MTCVGYPFAIALKVTSTKALFGWSYESLLKQIVAVNRPITYMIRSSNKETPCMMTC